MVRRGVITLGITSIPAAPAFLAHRAQMSHAQIARRARPAAQPISVFRNLT
jgi:hypothetical protein